MVMIFLVPIHPTGIYLFKVNNGNIRTIRETCSKLIIKTPDRINYVTDVVLASLMLTLNRIYTFFWYFHLLCLIVKFRKLAELTYISKNVHIDIK